MGPRVHGKGPWVYPEPAAPAVEHLPFLPPPHLKQQSSAREKPALLGGFGRSSVVALLTDTTSILQGTQMGEGPGWTAGRAEEDSKDG